MSTCDYPLPNAFPLPREDVWKHCYPKGGRKCWWYENGICYADEPGNHRYPHAAGRIHNRKILEDSRPEEQIDSDILRKCDEYGWRRLPWYTVTQGCCHPCFARCNDVDPFAECLSHEGYRLNDFFEDIWNDYLEDIENDDYED